MLLPSASSPACLASEEAFMLGGGGTDGLLVAGLRPLAAARAARLLAAAVLLARFSEDLSGGVSEGGARRVAVFFLAILRRAC
jgi:hypothetical protein